MPGASLREKLDALQQRHAALRTSSSSGSGHSPCSSYWQSAPRPGAGIATQLDELPGVARVATTAGTAVINALSLLVGFLLLTVAKPYWRSLLPGAIAGGIALVVVQVGGAWYFTRVG